MTPSPSRHISGWHELSHLGLSASARASSPQCSLHAQQVPVDELGLQVMVERVIPFLQGHPRPGPITAQIWGRREGRVSGRHVSAPVQLLGSSDGKTRPTEGQGWTQGAQCRPGWEHSQGSLAQGLPRAPHTPRAVAPLSGSLLSHGVPACRAWELPRIPRRELSRSKQRASWGVISR